MRKIVLLGVVLMSLFAASASAQCYYQTLPVYVSPPITYYSMPVYTPPPICYPMPVYTPPTYDYSTPTYYYSTPTYYGYRSPQVYVHPKYYVEGQPIRNFLQAITP